MFARSGGSARDGLETLKDCLDQLCMKVLQAAADAASAATASSSPAGFAS
jgi:hypothetical protein